jgi:hypothetical protein
MWISVCTDRETENRGMTMERRPGNLLLCWHRRTKTIFHDEKKAEQKRQRIFRGKSERNPRNYLLQYISVFRNTLE